MVKQQRHSILDPETYTWMDSGGLVSSHRLLSIHGKAANLQIAPRTIIIILIQPFLGPTQHTQKQLSKQFVLHMTIKKVKEK